MKKYKVKQTNDEKLICNMCGEVMTHYNYSGTFIWLCEGIHDVEKGTSTNGCTNVQFEYYNNTDLVELDMFLKERNNK